MLRLKFVRYKDGHEIQPRDNITLQAEGIMRRLIIRSAETSDAGSYTCLAGDNSIEFTVNIRGTGTVRTPACLTPAERRFSSRPKDVSLTLKGGLVFATNTEPPVMIVEPKDDVVMESYTSEEIRLQCELSRSSGKVRWFKDGQVVEDNNNVLLMSDGPYRRLTIFSGSVEDCGEYVCETDGDSVFFQLTVKGKTDIYSSSLKDF